MKIAFYNCREDEEEFVDYYADKYQVEAVKWKDSLGCGTIELAEGCDCVSITSDVTITGEMIDGLRGMGVRYLSTRTIGMEHIDCGYADEVGMGYGNISYCSDSVADEAIMLMLMVIRKVKMIMLRHMGQDFSLTGVQGRDFGEMTVGIIGTGAIGCALAKHLSGFGCRILACGHHANPDLPASAEYVELQKVLQESDILSLHIPSNRENYHFMDRERISRMKKDAVLINTARGDLVDTDALIDALEEGRLSGAGLDVIEGDREIYYRDHKDKQLCHRQKAILEAMPNVILLPHIGFCTRRAVSDMIQNSVKNCIEYLAEHPA